MIRTLLALVVAATLLPAVGRSAVISRDWKTPGDGLLTYDDVNQREWLDLSQTDLSPFSAVNREVRFLEVVAKTAPGGIFEGFAVADRLAVVNLAISAGIDTTSIDGLANEMADSQLAQLVGITHPSSQALHAVGLLDNFNPPPFAGRLGAHVLVDADSGPAGMAGILFSADDDLLFGGATGVWLYRSVPEPTGLAQVLIYICVGFAHSLRSAAIRV